MNSQDLTKWLHGRTVLVTGHTGFKGSWLVAMLNNLGAKVVGFSLPPEKPSLFEVAQIENLCSHNVGDIRDYAQVKHCFAHYQPEIVFHLAAQALVRPSYTNPLETFSTNTMGTANVLEAARNCKATKAIVCVTTDKVYENVGLGNAFTEADMLGGRDPYSASKAAAEIVASCYMQTLNGLGNAVRLATARGGNVIGGGDFAQERIIPDCVRAAQAKESMVLRNPNAVRPWQHVLDLCYGYVLLAHALETSNDPQQFVGAWNFGPNDGESLSVQNLVQQFLLNLDANIKIEIAPSAMPEHEMLKLNSRKANIVLNWQPKLNTQHAIDWSAQWYKNFALSSANGRFTLKTQLNNYFEI